MPLLPIPFKENLPKLLRENISTTGQAMVDKIDTHIAEWLEEIKKSGHYNSIDLCPSEFLDELGYLLSADIDNKDSDMEKRIKILNAIASHKRRYLFATIKVIIDLIMGGDSKLYLSGNQDDWIMNGNKVDDPDNYWGTMGIDGTDSDLGIWMVGTFAESVVQGNIYINVDNATATADQLADLEFEMNKYAPAYYVLYFGYFTTGFNTYFTIG